MRLLIHDFAGHPFAAELSRTLAGRGHEVTHGFCGGVTTGRGALTKGPDDPDSLSFVNVSDAPFERYSPIARLKSEVAYGRKLSALARSLHPDSVLSANCPLAAQAMLWRACRLTGSRRVYWLQDLLGRGTRAVLAARAPLLGATLGRSWEHLETLLLRRSDEIVVITPEFMTEVQRRGVGAPVRVVANWAPLGEVTVRPKRNPWSVANGVADRPLALYSGTLGLKHDPDHLVTAALAIDGLEMSMAVVTEGIGRDHLEARKTELGLVNLHLYDFVPYEQLPDLLGAADVCLVLLETEAGAFSAPSKVLTYLAAGRPIVGAMPPDNMASRTVLGAGAGEVVTPGDHAAFAAAMRRMLHEPDRAAALGRKGREHAEVAFAIGPIADSLEAALDTAWRPEPT